MALYDVFIHLVVNLEFHHEKTFRLILYYILTKAITLLIQHETAAWEIWSVDEELRILLGESGAN